MTLPREPPPRERIEARLARLETKFDERWLRVERVLERQCPVHERRLRDLERRMMVLWGASSAVFSASMMALLIWVRIVLEGRMG